MIPDPKYTLGGGLGIKVVRSWSVWSGHGKGGVDSTRPGGVEAGDAGRGVGAGGDELGGVFLHTGQTQG